MWKTDEDAADTGEDEDYRDEDLIQENNMLRDQISAIYVQIADTQAEATVNKTGREIQTEEVLAFTIEAVDNKLAGLNNSIAQQKARIKECAAEASEGLKKLHLEENKILELNQKLIHVAPIKARAAEISASNDLLQSKLNHSANQYQNLLIEINHHKATIANLRRSLGEKEEELGLDDGGEQLQEITTDLDMKVAEKAYQLQAAKHINEDYQQTLHRDDMKFIDSDAELKQWESKCEFQGKEIYKLATMLHTAKTENEELRRKIRSEDSKKLQRDAAPVSRPQCLLALPGMGIDVEDCNCVASAPRSED
ncbi:hypothetical protein B484DRAFT_480430 [Ochromonadaceae sp. CCMP2298]|nr:hypothetical protein B484DRAFT_480430 [Ochromonadaceae sp. CCMP2298]